MDQIQYSFLLSYNVKGVAEATPFFYKHLFEGTFLKST